MRSATRLCNKVRLVIARRFRCDAVVCDRQIFIERFEGILARSARRTTRTLSSITFWRLADDRQQASHDG
jgi:hypothetical protein